MTTTTIIVVIAFLGLLIYYLTKKEVEKVLKGKIDKPFETPAPVDIPKFILDNDFEFEDV